ncbi:MAG TPA: cell envelope integrity protein CreD [Saprospiraceae bacterium]|nr:cell envelope integrity protein CreD [Saprospiraceae bacterium]
MDETIKSNKKPQWALLFKLGFIFFLICLLNIPIFWITDLIYERQGLQQQVEKDISRAWGNAQTLTSPVLVIPFSKTKVVDKKSIVEDFKLYLAPELVGMDNNLKSEVRTKGIFNTIVYDNDCKINATFDLNNIKDEERQYALNKAYIIVGLSDPQAIVAGIKSNINGLVVKSFPGTNDAEFVKSGFHTPVNLTDFKDTLVWSSVLNFRGTSSLRFEPTAKLSQFEVKSNWASPSFIGRNLPSDRRITTTGFSSTWKASEFNRNTPDSWIDDTYVTSSTVFQNNPDYVNPNMENDLPGVELIETANHYHKNLRSIKYAFLIIFLSFLMYFSSEIFLKVRIHPIQYALIGISLVVFYTLLLSLSEQIGFNKSYFISFAAVLSLVMTYTYFVLKSWRPTIIIGFLFVLIYGYVFTLLQLEDLALLVGSVGIFFILAMVMFLSRKIDWYNIHSEIPNNMDA